MASNVFYELAIRHAIKKPLVQIIKKGEAIPFDVAGTRTVHVDHHDLDSVEEAKTEIVKQIKAVEKDASQVDTPISVALDLQLLKQSENPEQRSLADIVQAISELRSSLLSIDKRLSDPKSLIPPELQDSMARRTMRSMRSREYMSELVHLSNMLNDSLSKKRASAEERDLTKDISSKIMMLAKRVMMEE